MVRDRIKERAVSLVELNLESVRMRKHEVLQVDGAPRGRFAWRGVRISREANAILSRLMADGQSRIQVAEDSAAAYQQAVVNLRKLLLLAQRNARDRNVSARIAGVRSLGRRPIVSSLDLQKALKALCPLWPFC